MGKPTAEDQGGGDPEAGAGGPALLCCCCSWGLGGIHRFLSLRCVLVLLLSVCVFLSAVFWLPPLRARRSGDGADTNSASVQASFILQRSISFVAAYTGQLEYDIFGEIGVPNTKVSIIAMRPLPMPNSTYVVFGILPDSRYGVISPVVLSVLRSSLIELALQHTKLSLTSSVFGQPSSFEVLRFPGGITVIPDQSIPIWQITQILFNFTLNNSIIQVQKNLDELKGQLKFGLSLRSSENVYVQITNVNGSTVAPPVVVQASVLSDVGSRILLPPRLKQLAQTITRTHAKNLGLDHAVFGRVKEVRLSSYLNHSITAIESPSPSPSPSNEPHDSGAHPVTTHPVPSPTYAPAPSTDSSHASSCLNCKTSSPFGSPSHAPAQDEPRPPSPQYSSPSPSVTTAHAPRHSPCLFPQLPPDVAPVVPTHPPVSAHVPHAPVPSLRKEHAPVTMIAPSPQKTTHAPATKIAPSPQKTTHAPATRIAPSPQKTTHAPATKIGSPSQKTMGPAPGTMPDSSPSSARSRYYSMSPQYGKGSGKSGKASNSPMFTSPISPSPLPNSAVPLCSGIWMFGLLGIMVLLLIS